MENLRTQLEQAKLTGSSEGSRNNKSQCSCEAQENEAACSDNTTRRFSTTDEGYDTTHSIEGDSPSHRKLPDMAPPIITHSPGRNPARNCETVSKTMKALKLKKLWLWLIFFFLVLLASDRIPLLFWRRNIWNKYLELNEMSLQFSLAKLFRLM